MGTPSAPAPPPPTADELAANEAANREKEAALAKINQGIYASSQGLRGSSSLYDWAGPTPGLAANAAPGYVVPGTLTPTPQTPTPQTPRTRPGSLYGVAPRNGPAYSLPTVGVAPRNR